MQDGSGNGDDSMITEPWRHKAQIRGGAHRDDGGSEEYDIGGEGMVRDGGGMYIPKTGIRVRTTVTITEKVDWLDDLY